MLIIAAAGTPSIQIPYKQVRAVQSWDRKNLCAVHLKRAGLEICSVSFADKRITRGPLLTICTFRLCQLARCTGSKNGTQRHGSSGRAQATARCISTVIQQKASRASIATSIRFVEIEYAEFQSGLLHPFIGVCSPTKNP